MRRLKRFLRLSGPERALLLQAIVSIIVVRLALPCLPLAKVRQLLNRMIWRIPGNFAADRIVWAMRAAARLIPGSTCLIQALAARALLVRYGYNARLNIGVTKSGQVSFQAHAWVTCDEVVVIGGPEVKSYTLLLNLGTLP